MEKQQQSKLKSKILKIIPKAAAAVSLTFQNPPFSPGRDHKLKSENGTTRFKAHGGGKGFSGPMIPDEARRRPRDAGNETQEPTSPKISCMGQIKQKKKQIKKSKAQSMSLPTHAKGVALAGSASSTPRKTEEKKHASSKLQRMFLLHTAKPKTAARKSNASAAAPPLGEMRRFASGRETFSNFDWKTQIAPEERDCYTDDERVESDAEDEIIIPFSAPLTAGVGGGSVPIVQPRKEINLWKRRTMAPPRPLQLKPVLTAK